MKIICPIAFIIDIDIDSSIKIQEKSKSSQTVSKVNLILFEHSLLDVKSSRR